MEATLRLVADRGIAGTAVVDIEAAAGLAPGRGGFYRHFPGKHEALQAALDAELDRLRARQRGVEVDGAAPATLAEELQAGLAWLQELSPLITIVIRDGASLPEVRRSLRQIIATGGVSPGLEKVLAAAAASGRDPVVSAVVVTMASLGFHLAGAFFGGSVEGVDANSFVSTLADMVESAPKPAQP